LATVSRRRELSARARQQESETRALPRHLPAAKQFFAPLHGAAAVIACC
jgi:hypothetical protein